MNPEQSTYHYLALGDSYTIGEMVPEQENFPNQVAAMLKETIPGFQSPRIIARTGWTTDELKAGIYTANTEDPLRPEYDFVTLLIGVNNQYRGRTVDSYREEFEELMKKTLRFAGNRTDRVVIISIPDWGITPFAAGSDQKRIATEIDAYNKVNQQLADTYHIYYIDITPWTREAAADASLLTNDNLHPSAKEYRRWAEKISAYFMSKI